MDPLRFFEDRVAHLLSFQCCVVLFCFVFVLYLMPNAVCIWIVHCLFPPRCSLTFIEYCVLVVLYIITVVSFIFIYISVHGYKDIDI